VWWLSPPLRLKAGYAPDRWVAVRSVPPTAPKVPATTGSRQDAAAHHSTGVREP